MTDPRAEVEALPVERIEGDGPIGDHDADLGFADYGTVEVVSRAAVLTILARPAPPSGGLDAAWAEAEAALPEGWRIYSVHRDQRQDRGGPEAWSVIAHTAADGYHATEAVHTHKGTLAAALRALRAALTPADPSADRHGFTCGLCQWGRDSVHGEAAYKAHMAHVHPSADR